MSKLGLAISITAVAFQDKVDKGGKPYMLHCLHVMHKVGQKSRGDQELMMIAVMHDLIEDTDYTFEDLVELGFSDRVIAALTLLTHYPIGHPHGKTYDRYIQDIAPSADARMVKLEDLDHNSKIHRMKGLREKDFKRLEKYHRSYAYLDQYVPLTTGC